MLYNIALCLLYFIYSSLYLSIPYHLFAPAPIPLSHCKRETMSLILDIILFTTLYLYPEPSTFHLPWLSAYSLLKAL